MKNHNRPVRKSDHLSKRTYGDAGLGIPGRKCNKIGYV